MICLDDLVASYICEVSMDITENLECNFLPFFKINSSVEHLFLPEMTLTLVGTMTSMINEILQYLPTHLLNNSTVYSGSGTVSLSKCFN